VVTAEAVWEALAEIPDPEIPVISLVDLGVIRDVTVDGGTVRVELTPTFLGCPALEVMRRALEEAVAGLGATPEVAVIQDDSWSTDARATAVEGVPLPLLRVDRDEAREHLRPDPVPLDPLVRELPPALRAVQDDLGVGPRHILLQAAEPLELAAEPRSFKGSKGRLQLRRV
jgi:metal-sulfur cluster biosynthetic enzyme